LARMWPSSRMRHIWVMNSSSPASPSPQPMTTSAGAAAVKKSARTARMRVRTIAKFSADGIHCSRNRLIGRMIPFEAATLTWVDGFCADMGGLPLRTRCVQRSEEHTSELQSRFDLVCRLLLEKKNNNNQYIQRRKQSQVL